MGILGRNFGLDGVRSGHQWGKHLAMGQKPVPPVNIPVPTKID